MKINFRAGLLALAVSFLCVPTFAGGGKNPPASVTFRDYPGDSSTPADKIRSDFGGTYANGVAGTAVYFVSNGNLVLDLGSSTRSLYLDFSTPDTSLNQSLGLNPPDLTGSYRVYLSNNVDAPDGTCTAGTGLLGMANGSGNNSCFWVSFTDSSGNAWVVRFAHSLYANTTDAWATRSADGLSWTLETAPGSVAALIQTTKKGSVVRGYFFMPSKLTIAKQ